MRTEQALEFLSELAYHGCQFCSKYEECNKLDNSESICENAKFIILKSLNRLEKENKKLLINKNIAQGIATNLKQENDKLKKGIKILVETLGIKLRYCVYDGKIDDWFLETNLQEESLTKEQYEVLKEVLENE